MNRLATTVLRRSAMCKSAVRASLVRQAPVASLMFSAPRTSSVSSRVALRFLSFDADKNNEERFDSDAQEHSFGDSSADIPIVETNTLPEGRETGFVKWFDAEKGFGFIVRDLGGSDLFCHFTGISGTGYRTLEEGQRVEFSVAQGAKGLAAHEVVIKS